METQFEDQTREAVRRGQRAKALLEDPILAGAFEGMEAQIIEAWKASLDPVERELLHHRCIALKALKSELEILVGRGEWAEDDRKKAERRQKFGANL